MMKKKLSIFFIGILSIFIAGSMNSCNDYLEREPATDIDPEMAFTNFFNFQGFVDELYTCMPNMLTIGNSSFNWAEEEHYSINGQNTQLGYIDRGQFFGALSKHLYNTSANPTNNDRNQKAFWQLGWNAIRKANLGIENLEKMTGTDEEKNLIAGQLYFFRGWFHYMLANYWGGLPYIDYVLPAGEKVTLPRESYEECMLKAIKDFDEAEKYLPTHWNNTTAGQVSVLTNELRINKFMAKCFAAKAYLYLGSPWIKWLRSESWDNNDPASPAHYEREYCMQAANRFGEFLQLVENDELYYTDQNGVYKKQYELLTWEKFHEHYLTEGDSHRLQGGNEAIFRSPRYNSNGDIIRMYHITNWVVSTRNYSLYPTANYSNFFGMADGRPINNVYDKQIGASTVSDGTSSYNPVEPWTDRDPRFYKNYTFDGNSYHPTNKVPERRRARLFSFSVGDPDTYRYPGYTTDRTGSTTGLLLTKWYKRFDANGMTYQIMAQNAGVNHNRATWGLSWMRLGDVYLMYAEALAIGKQSTSTASDKCNLTALDAVDKIRARANNMPGFHADYRTDVAKFIRELRRERAMELAFEGHRYFDLKRWLLWDQEPYTVKTSFEFERGDFIGDIENDPANEHKTQYKLVNAREEIILKRDFDKKHYWFPIPSNQTYFYPEFGQNPGW